MLALRSSLWLAGRSLLLVRRLPSVFIPSLVMPLFILVATAGKFGNAADRLALVTPNARRPPAVTKASTSEIFGKPVPEPA